MQKPITWMWNKKHVLIEDLDEKKLYSVKKLIESDKQRMWFGYKSDDILNEINQSLAYKQQVYKLIKNMRVKRAIVNSDLILNGMVKCMIKTNEKLLN